MYFSLYQKGRGTDTVLSQVQSLGLRIKRIKSFDISDVRKTLSSRIVKLPFSKQSLGLRINSFNISNLRKTLSSRKYLSPSRKTYCNVLLQKMGRGTDTVIAVFTQCFQSWPYTTETESTNCGTTSPDGKLLKHPTKELAVRGKPHY